MRVENRGHLTDRAPPMSKPKDPQSRSDAGKSDERTEPTAVGDQGPQRRSGRVAYDSRGNPVWEWQLETGVYTRDVSTQKLKKLDLGELSLVDTGIHQKKSPGVDAGPKAGGGFNPYERPAGGGFNPYDKGPASTGFNPYDSARSAGNRLKDQPTPEPPARKPSDMRKLDEWIKLRKKLQEKGEKDE